MATAKVKRKPSKKTRLSKIESYKAANIKEMQFRRRFCVVAHGYIHGCCCSSYWAPPYRYAWSFFLENGALRDTREKNPELGSKKSDVT